MVVLVALGAPPARVSAQTLTAQRLGGLGDDPVRDVSFDAEGNLYVAGGTGSSDFPRTLGPAFNSMNVDGASFGAFDAFVAKYSPDGTLLWARLIGGPGYDRAYGIEALSDGCLIAGRAGTGFPTTAGVVQPTFAGDVDVNPGYGPQDGFVARFDADGGLAWATYLGGPGRELIRDLAVDASGRTYAALTGVRTLPHITPGAYDTTAPTLDADDEIGAVVRLSSDGTTVEWGTYLAGDTFPSSRGRHRALGNPSIRVGSDGTVYVLGYTDQRDFPVTPGAYQPTLAGMSDLTLTALRADGAALVFSTYLGGSGFEGLETHSLWLAGDRLVVGAGTTSSDLPLTPGTVGSAYHGGGDVMVAVFQTDGTHVATTLIGGPGDEHGEGVGVLSTGEIVVSGRSAGPMYPTTHSTWEGGSTRDGHLTVLSPDLRTIVFAARIGGTTLGPRVRSDVEELRSVAIGPDDEIAAGGQASTTDFPVTDGSSHGGGAVDGVVVRLRLPRTTPPPRDAGVDPLVDGGVPVVPDDAATPIDGAVVGPRPAADAGGAPPEMAGGCTCRTHRSRGDGGFSALAFLVLVAVRRLRRRARASV